MCMHVTRVDSAVSCMLTLYISTTTRQPSYASTASFFGAAAANFSAAAAVGGEGKAQSRAGSHDYSVHSA